MCHKKSPQAGQAYGQKRKVTRNLFLCVRVDLVKLLHVLAHLGRSWGMR